MRLRLSERPHTLRWLWGAGIGLVICVAVGICVLLVTHNRALPSYTELETSIPSVVVPSSSPNIEPAAIVAKTPPLLPRVDFPPGSVEMMCGLNELPSYWVEDGGLKRNNYYSNVLESEECQTALETHMNTMNPYRFFWGEALYYSRSFAFVVLDEPLTFNRIFADPSGDLLRVQEALSRPECLLQGDETNWELKETCHAEAFLNYALINRFCFDEGILKRNKMYYWREDNPTPEQDRSMWKQGLEAQWVEDKCEELDSALEFTSERYPELYSLVKSINEPDQLGGSRVLLIELAARLGDNAAGLAEGYGQLYGDVYPEQGYKYGRFSGLLTSDAWREFTWKHEPSSDRFLRTFKMLTLASAHRPDPRDEIELDWVRVAQHLCTPPYHDYEEFIRTKERWAKSPHAVERELAVSMKIDPPKSCQEVIHELRQRNLKFAPLLRTLEKFEQVAIELGVYE